MRTLRYGWWTYVLGERTTPRLSQNSKIISVDGNLASGKGALAQKLAEKLGMFVPKLFPQIQQITNLLKLLVVSSLAQQMLNPKLLPVSICEYLSLILSCFT